MNHDAFSDCKSLVCIIIPDSIDTIESGTFEYCSSLKKITLPESIAEIEPDAFWGCDSIRKVIALADIDIYDMFSDDVEFISLDDMNDHHSKSKFNHPWKPLL